MPAGIVRVVWGVVGKCAAMRDDEWEVAARFRQGPVLVLKQVRINDCRCGYVNAYDYCTIVCRGWGWRGSEDVVSCHCSYLDRGFDESGDF